MKKELPGIATKVYPYPGYCATVLQESQSFSVRVWESYRTYRGSGYGYICLNELPEVPGIVAQAYGTHNKSFDRVQNIMYPPRVSRPQAYRTSRSCGYTYECRTELPEVSGTGKNALQN